MDKPELRRRLRALRLGMSPDRERASEALAARLLPHLARLKPGRVIAGYVATGGEIDPAPLLKALSDGGHRIALPRMNGVGRPLGFHRWRPGAALHAGPHDVPEPDAAAEHVRPDILLVPCLGFDGLGGRLGQGGGYYDRTLAALRADGDALAIGLAYDIQRVDRLPGETHDQPLDLVATPEALYDPGGSGLIRLEST